MDNKAMYKIGYGLYVLSARVNGADNACIINTAIQVTSAPNRISVTVNKQNKTHDMIVDSGKFNISMLSESADFAVSDFRAEQMPTSLRIIPMLQEVKTE